MVSTLPVSDTVEVGVWKPDTSLVLGWLRLAPQPLCEWKQGHKVSSEHLQGLEGWLSKGPGWLYREASLDQCGFLRWPCLERTCLPPAGSRQCCISCLSGSRCSRI